MKIVIALLLMLSLNTISNCSSSVSTADLNIPDETPFKKIELSTLLNPPGYVFNYIDSSWKSLSLAGQWKFIETPFQKELDIPAGDPGVTAGYFKNDFSDGPWKDAAVPDSFYNYGNFKGIGKIGWFRKEFKLEKDFLENGSSVVLDFRRAGDKADVWINGQKAGPNHSGRFDSFQYDITNLVKPGSNLIAVRIYDYMGNTEPWHRLGGIYAPPRLLSVPANIYAINIMPTVIFDKNSVSIEAEITNPSEKETNIALTAEISGWRDNKIVATAKLPTFKAATGKTWVLLGEIKIPDPTPWTPENPYLYALRLINKNGKTVGAARFGFREFTASGKWLWLNKKKFKPRMYTAFTLSKAKRIYNNNDGDMEKLLSCLKSLNVNMIRPHSGFSSMPDTFYNICDEIGMLVYIDWNGSDYASSYDKPRKNYYPEGWPTFERFIKENSAHPSICMFSLGNEIYEGLLDGNLSYNDELDKLYGLVKQTDRQKRPVCSSSGRQVIESMKAGQLKERTDIFDDHQYRGAYCGTWIDNIKHIEDYAAIAEKYYGKPKPIIDAEYGCPGDSVRYRASAVREIFPVFQLPRNTAEFKKKYIDLIKSPRPDIGEYLRVKMNYSSPAQFIDETACKKLYADRLFKYPVEIYRRAGEKCLGGHTNAYWYDVVAPSNFCESLTNFGLSGPIDPKSTEWVAMPLYFQMKKIYHPLLVSAWPFNQQPLPGSKQTIEIFVTNDLNERGNFKVIPKLALDKNEAIVFNEIDFGTLDGMGQKSVTFEYTVPHVKDIARGRLEFHLFKDGVKVNYNYYPMFVAETPLPLDTVPIVALYDSSGKLFSGLVSGPSTSNVLKELKFPCREIRDFDALDSYKYLIIGSNSMDKKVSEAGGKIHTWIKNGGKLLCFEQSLCGKMPFFPHYSITSGSGANCISLAVETHPVFEGLVQDDFYFWSGFSGLMYSQAIRPLDAGMVAVAPTAAYRDADNVKSVLVDVKSGKGQIILSQINAVKRFNECSVARLYLAGLLKYFASPGASEFAFEVGDGKFSKSDFVDEKDALYVDLSKFANRGFSDWTGLGASIDDIPRGITRLEGSIPFNIINKDKSCIILKSKKTPEFPEKISGIPVNALLNSVFFLHTTMYSEPGAVVRYVFHYEDGQTKEFTATSESDIPDWWEPKDRINAVTVFQKNSKGLYMSEFINPISNVMIKSMDIISCGKSVPVIVAVTGRKKFTSIISGVGEK